MTRVPARKATRCSRYGGTKVQDMAALAMAIPRIAQNVAHSGRCDGLMSSLRPPAACLQAGYIRFNRPSGENFEQGA